MPASAEDFHGTGPTTQDPDSNVYRNLEFPNQVYGKIQEFYRARE
jgi:hypothetical protein